MIEYMHLLLCSKLEVILFLIVLFIILHRRAIMETIWGDFIENGEDSVGIEENNHGDENHKIQSEKTFRKVNGLDTTDANYENKSNGFYIDNLGSEVVGVVCEDNIVNFVDNVENTAYTPTDVSLHIKNDEQVIDNSVGTTNKLVDQATTIADEEFFLEDDFKSTNSDKYNVNDDNANFDKSTPKQSIQVFLGKDETEKESEDERQSSNESISKNHQDYIVNIPKTILSSVQHNNVLKTVSIMYEVDGDVFQERDHLESRDSEELIPFDVYKMDLSVVDNEDFTTPLELHIQTLQQGVIINSNVFLWDAQWHTVVKIDEQLFRCAVCQVFCDRESCETHVESFLHLQNLKKYKPLKLFDLNIVRKINSDLHCGVCNEIIDIIDYRTHENSKSHEQCHLSAVNKVSDFIYDCDIYEGDRPKDFHRSYAFIDNDRSIPINDRYTSNVDGNLIDDRNRDSGNDDSNAVDNVQVYEESCEEDEDEEEEIEEEDIEEEDEFEEYNPPRQGVSYASMAKKPTIQLPKYLTIKLGTRVERVKFDSWHMILGIKPNRFHCMVCNKIDLLRFKSQHCISCEHLEKLAQCILITAYKQSLVRMLDDKFFHCSECNSLQYQNQIEDHIASTHPMRNTNFIEMNTGKTNTTSKNKPVIEPKKADSGISANVHKSLECVSDIERPASGPSNTGPPSIGPPSIGPPQIRPLSIGPPQIRPLSIGPPQIRPLSIGPPQIRPLSIGPPQIGPYSIGSPKISPPRMGLPRTDPNFDIFGDIPLMPFDCELWIPALNFNFVMKVEDEYYCVICEVIVGDVKNHIRERNHVHLMNITPFIQPFQNNLTRAVGSMFHCSICNIIFAMSHVNNHNKDPLHTTGLAKAKSVRKPLKPENTEVIIPILEIQNLKTQTTDQTAAQKIPQANTVVQDEKNLNKDSNEYLMNILKVTRQNTQYAGQNLQYAAQNQPQAGQNLQYAGKNQSHAGQNLQYAVHNPPYARQGVPNAGQNLPYGRHNLPHAGQNPHFVGQTLPNAVQNQPNSGRNSPFAQNLSTKTSRTVTPMSNPTFPTLPPVNKENLKLQFEGRSTDFKPRPALSMSHIIPEDSPKLLTPKNIINSVQNLADKNLYNPTCERKTITISDGNDKGNSVSNQNSGSSRPASDMTRRDSAISRRDSINTRSASIDSRRDSVSSRRGSFNSRLDRLNSRRDSDNSRREHDNYLDSTDTIDNLETDSLTEDEIKVFDEQEMVFVKFKNTYFKITIMSYNSIIYLDSGIRYCFVCSCVVYKNKQQKHIESRKHVECLLENNFLENYGVQLFRQLYLMYHCAICNVLMTRKEIKLHQNWSGHVEFSNIAQLKLTKKNQKELKSGLKIYIVHTQKEAIYHNVNEPSNLIKAAYKIDPDFDDNKDSIENRPAKNAAVVMKNKIVIQNNLVMKIPFGNWNSIATAKNVTKCILCQMEVEHDQVLKHVETHYHSVALGKTFEKIYLPALIRKINEVCVNCMTCNLELTNNEYMIHEHIMGRKHNKNLEIIIKETSNSDSYADCYEEFLNI